MPADTTGRRQRLARAERAAQLLVVAEEVFVQRGFQAASMDEIADRAGVTKPVIYDHFGSKDGLLAAVMERLGAELRGATERAVADAADARDALARGLAAYFSFLDAHAQAWSLLLTELAASSVAAGVVEQIRRAQADYIAGLIAAEMRTPDRARADVYAQAVVGAAERLATVRRHDPTLTAQRVTEQLLELLWPGLDQLRM